MRMVTSILILAGLFVLAACGGQEGDGHDHAHHREAAQAESAAVVKPYPLDTCLVMGGKLGAMGDPVVLVHEGQEWKFCCQGCVATFQADPEGWTRKLAEAVAAQVE